LRLYPVAGALPRFLSFPPLQEHDGAKSSPCAGQIAWTALPSSPGRSDTAVSSIPDARKWEPWEYRRGYEERPLVSVDYLNAPRSAIVDALSTMVIDGTQVKILAWYDNEWGHANRLVELAQKVAAALPPVTEPA